MSVTRVASAREFLEQSLELRAKDPFRTNLIGSVATAIANSKDDTADNFWWIVRDANDDVVAIMMRTPPHNLVLTPMTTNLIAECVVAIIDGDPEFPGVSGPKNVVQEFLQLYQSALSVPRTIESSRGELLYALTNLAAPQSIGTLRHVRIEDWDLALKWLQEFFVEVDLIAHDLEQALRDRISEERLFFWLVNEQPVSMVGFAPLVQTPAGDVARIGPVYTPPELRGHGYASFATAAVSEKLLNLGAQLMLYTDAANPTSNGIYMKLGYELIDENISIHFE